MREPKASVYFPLALPAPGGGTYEESVESKEAMLQAKLYYEFIKPNCIDKGCQAVNISPERIEKELLRAKLEHNEEQKLLERFESNFSLSRKLILAAVGAGIWGTLKGEVSEFKIYKIKRSTPRVSRIKINVRPLE